MLIGDYTILNKNYAELIDFAKSQASSYQSADPFPSIYFDDFFNEEFSK